MELNKEISDFRCKENFPVASMFLPKVSRKPILDFYVFARLADEIADSKTLSKEEKLEQLNEIYTLLKYRRESEKYPYMKDLFKHIDCGSFSIRNCKALIEAFIQDAENPPYNSFEELIEYCQKSASSVGRVVLESCEEFSADIRAADSICMVLQILNHVQDLKADYTNLNRLYFSPLYFSDLKEITAERESEAVTNFKNDILARAFAILNSAKHLPKTISSFRVRIELQTIINICFKLHDKLLHNDILAKRVELDKSEKAECFLNAFKQAFAKNKSHEERLLPKNSRSSFFLPMLKLPAEKKKAIFAIYSFCRAIDNITDDSENAATSIKKLEFWRDEIDKIYFTNTTDYPIHPVSRALMKFVKIYSIPKEYFIELIEGQLLDLSGRMIKPSDELYHDYCYKVASAVGLLSVQIFGYKKENEEKIKKFAEHLGLALQTINIMRDVREDAGKNRIYIPYSYLADTKLQDIYPLILFKNFKDYKFELQLVFKELSKKVEYHFKQSENNLPKEEVPNMKVALLMRKVYEAYFNKMKAKDFFFDKEEIKLTKFEKIKLFFSK